MAITKWKKQDGTVVEIADMSDDHLNNTILMFDRRGMCFYQDLKHMALIWNSDAYLFNASEHVADAVAREADCVAERLEEAGLEAFETMRCMAWLPVYEALCAERAQRIATQRWTCTALLHQPYDASDAQRRVAHHLYACSVNDDLTLGGKGDSV